MAKRHGRSGVGGWRRGCCRVALLCLVSILLALAGSALGQDAAPVGVEAPSLVQGVLDEAGALSASGKDLDAFKRLAAFDPSQISGAPLKSYADAVVAVLNAAASQLKALDGAKKPDEAGAQVEAYRAAWGERSGAASQTKAVGLASESDARALLSIARAMVEARLYLEGAALAQSVDPAVGPSLGGDRNWILKWSPSFWWSREERPALRKLREDAATRGEAVESARAGVEKLAPFLAGDGGETLANARMELADTLLSAGQHDDALAACRTAAAALPTSCTWGVAKTAADFPSRCATSWLNAQSDALKKLSEEKGKEQAAYERLQEMRAKVAAWGIPEPEKVLKEKELDWAKGALTHIRDEKQLDEALDILAANKPQQGGGYLWLAPVIRNKEITKQNLEALIDVWYMARTSDKAGLLYRKACARSADLPLDEPVFKDPAHGWSAVWMLIESGKRENMDKADALIERLYSNNAIEADYASSYSLWMRGRYEEAIAAADRMLKNPDAANVGGPQSMEGRLWAQITKLRSLEALQRTDEAREVARQIIQSWPDGKWTQYAQFVLNRLDQGDSGEPGGAQGVKSKSEGSIAAPRAGERMPPVRADHTKEGINQ